LILNGYHTIAWNEGVVSMLDQRLLPDRIVYQEYTNAGQVAAAIKVMVIRGAPAIGAAAAFGLALSAFHSRSQYAGELRVELEQAAAILREARPTAANLNWALERVMSRLKQAGDLPADELKALVVAEAAAIAAEDVQINRQMGLNGLPLVPEGAKIIHHCNTGALATVDIGTALGVIRTAHEHGRQVYVYVDETRPRLQGARLTSWELQQLKIPHTVVVDGASGYLMSRVGIDLCLVGADRVAANGDTANKIGTFNLALAARAHGVPFYVVAPTSTIDLSTLTGKEIDIEQRPDEEVSHIGERRIVAVGSPVANPAFDVTPAACITAIITEKGVAYPPYHDSLPRLFQ
jgi:methylthioribose-1-phosphate isomerase